MSAPRERLERYFEFQALGADWKTETIAGATTFMTMAYIVFVNQPRSRRRRVFRPLSAAF